MDAVGLIQQHMSVEKLLEHYNFNITLQEGSMARMACKIHGGNNPTSFAINLETGLYFCHTGCGEGGDIFTLVEKMEGYEGKSSFPQAVRWLADFFEVDISGVELSKVKSRNAKELEKFMKIMQSGKKKQINEYEIKEELRKVTKFRDFNKETLEHFDLCFVPSITLNKKSGGTYTLCNRLVFPVIFKGKQVGALLRKTKSSDVPKWSNQPANLETKNILYNYDATEGSTTVAICEGITDVWAFHEIGVTAVATFGAHITNNQYKLLLKTGADLVFAYDGDNAGRLATDKAIKMFKYKANMSRMEFEEGGDPGSINREELAKLYGERKRA